MERLSSTDKINNMRIYNTRMSQIEIYNNMKLYSDKQQRVDHVHKYIYESEEMAKFINEQPDGSKGFRKIDYSVSPEFTYKQSSDKEVIKSRIRSAINRYKISLKPSTIENALGSKGLPEGLIKNILKYHGCVNHTFPAEKFNETTLKKYMQYITSKNWHIRETFTEGELKRYYNIYLEVSVDRLTVDMVIRNEVSVTYTYPTKYGSMSGQCRINERIGNNIKIMIKDKEYTLNIDKFEVLRLS